MKWLFLGFVVVIGEILAPILMVPALFFATRFNTNNIFPPWLQWLNTPDDPGCFQGMDNINNEQQVIDVKEKFGWYGKTWYWLGWRNTFYGLMAYLCDKYEGSPVTESMWWKFKIYSVPGHKEITWPGRRVSFGYKVETLKTAKIGDPIWWVFMPAFWKARP